MRVGDHVLIGCVHEGRVQRHPVSTTSIEVLRSGIGRRSGTRASKPLTCNDAAVAHNMVDICR